jgi:hypothetical protein
VDLFLVISQGIGLALACGLRPFLPMLVAGILAAADAGLDFDGTDYQFLESLPFLVVIGVMAIAWWPVIERRRTTVALTAMLAALAVVAGALEFAGSLADEDYASAPGLAAGAACALVGWAAAAAFLGGVRARLESRGAPADYISVFAEGAGACLAVIAIAIAPLSYLALGFCVWLLMQRRRRAGQKYEGLRVLR